MNYFAGIAFLIALGLSIYFTHSYDGYKNEAAWNKFKTESQQKVSDAQSQARKEQQEEDAKLLSDANDAVDRYKQAAKQAGDDLQIFKSHTKAVSHVPEVRNWLCTRIPVALTDGLRDGPSAASSQCAGAGEVHPNPARPANANPNQL